MLTENQVVTFEGASAAAAKELRDHITASNAVANAQAASDAATAAVAQAEQKLSGETGEAVSAVDALVQALTDIKTALQG